MRRSKGSSGECQLKSKPQICAIGADGGQPWLEKFLVDRTSDKRHDAELWAFEYECLRYLKNVADPDLDKRFYGLCRNLAFLVCDLRDPVPLRAHFLSTWWWLKKRVQMLAEYQFRHRPPPDVSSLESLIESPVPICKPRRPNDSNFIVRYSEERWLRDFVDNGTVRIAPASGYKGETVDEARKDDELNKHTYSRGDKVTITTMDGRSMPIIGDLKRTRSLRVNYYVLCTANEHDPRLFSSFPNQAGEPADACAIVWDTEEFARRLELAGRTRLPKWLFHRNPVHYFDPYNLMPGEDVSPGMSKDFSYAYQREYRFLWLPPPGTTADQPLFLNVGPLNDIAGLIRRDGAFVAGRQSA